MKKKLKQFFILICLVVLLILPYFVFAASPLNKLKSVGSTGGYDTSGNETQFAGILGTVVGVFLSLLGIIFVILTVYAGYRWMTAGGNEEKVTKAKETLWRSIIGLIIVVGSYAIWTLISSSLFSQ